MQIDRRRSIFNFVLASLLLAVLAGGERAAAQCAAADINDNGVVDAEDLALVLAVWGTNNAAADLNHDGVVEGADLTLVLGSWGPCGTMRDLTAFITNAADNTLPPPFGIGTVIPLNLASGQAGCPIEVGNHAGTNCIIVTSDGAHAFVTNEFTSRSNGRVNKINLATGEVSCPITVGERPVDINFVPHTNEQWAWVANYGGNTVTTVNLHTCEVGATITGPFDGPNTVAFTPDGSWCYVANWGTDQTAGSTVTRIMVTGGGATGIVYDSINVGQNPNWIAFTKDGATAYVANKGSSSITPIDVAAFSAGQAIDMPGPAIQMEIAPDGKLAYVAIAGIAPEIDAVVPIDLSVTPVQVKPTIHLASGAQPHWIAFTPDGTTAYVVGNGNGTLTPITVASGTAEMPIQVSTDPHADILDIAILSRPGCRHPRVPSWATLVTACPDPNTVTSKTLRDHIVKGGWAWKVRDNITGIEMVWIPLDPTASPPSATFTMGCSPASTQTAGCLDIENPPHAVTLTSEAYNGEAGFYMSVGEVTQAEWMYPNQTSHPNPSYFLGSDLPVETVRYSLVNAWLKSASTGSSALTSMRLPTEAEWEYAYRAGTTTAFHGYPGESTENGSNDPSTLMHIAWYAANSEGKTHAITEGNLQPNGFGLYNMSGNVWEWVSDRRGNYENVPPGDNPQGVPINFSTCAFRFETPPCYVLRGGHWGDNTTQNGSDFLRSSTRGGYPDVVIPDVERGLFGFRVARNAESPSP